LGRKRGIYVGGGGEWYVEGSRVVVAHVKRSKREPFIMISLTNAHVLAEDIFLLVNVTNLTSKI
jgi:hypothetical protein